MKCFKISKAEDLDFKEFGGSVASGGLLIFCLLIREGSDYIGSFAS